MLINSTMIPFFSAFNYSIVMRNSVSNKVRLQIFKCEENKLQHLAKTIRINHIKVMLITETCSGTPDGTV